MTAKSRRQQILEMLEHDPDEDGFLRYCLAMEYQSGGDDAQALTTFRDLIAAKPGYIPAYLQLGQLLTRLGKEDEAKSTYRTGIGMAQQVGDAHAAGEMTGFLNMLE